MAAIPAFLLRLADKFLPPPLMPREMPAPRHFPLSQARPEDIPELERDAAALARLNPCSPTLARIMARVAELRSPG